MFSAAGTLSTWVVLRQRKKLMPIRSLQLLHYLMGRMYHSARQALYLELPRSMSAYTGRMVKESTAQHSQIEGTPLVGKDDLHPAVETPLFLGGIRIFVEVIGTLYAAPVLPADFNREVHYFLVKPVAKSPFIH